MKKLRLLNVVPFLLAAVSINANAAGVSGQGTWETTLQGRDLDGNAATFEAYYDTVLDITWLADAFANGATTWDVADTWAKSLSFGSGIDNWRLPTLMDEGCTYGYTGTDCGYNVKTGSASTTVYSEMASMFYDTLGNVAFFDTSGNGLQFDYGLSNTGPFERLLPMSYWSVEYAPNTANAWTFINIDGGQSYNSKNNTYSAWAVHDGDIGAVPILPALWLFGSGLLGQVGIARRKKAS